MILPPLVAAASPVVIATSYHTFGQAVHSTYGDSMPNGGWLDSCLDVVARGAEVLRRIADEEGVRGPGGTGRRGVVPSFERRQVVMIAAWATRHDAARVDRTPEEADVV